MNINSIQKQFENELQTLRNAPTARSRKYSAELKNALLHLSNQGFSSKFIREKLDLPKNALDCLLHAHKAMQANFKEVKIDKALSPIQPLKKVELELDQKIVLRIFY